MKVQIILVPYDSAYRDLRMGSGPLHFHRLPIDKMLKTWNEVQVDFVELEELSFRAEIASSFQLYRQLADRVRTAVNSDRFPLVLSGNCGSALGAIAGLNEENLGVVWFDGHGDFNTPETTTSGFLDGMCLATAVGLCWKALARSIPGFKQISGTNVIHCGSRDVKEGQALIGVMNPTL